MVHVENVEVPQIVQEITRSAVVVFVKHLLVVLAVRLVVVVPLALVDAHQDNFVLIVYVLIVEVILIVLQVMNVLMVYVLAWGVALIHNVMMMNDANFHQHLQEVLAHVLI